jgi:hypothetical protein
MLLYIAMGLVLSFKVLVRMLATAAELVLLACPSPLTNTTSGTDGCLSLVSAPLLPGGGGGVVGEDVLLLGVLAVVLVREAAAALASAAAAAAAAATAEALTVGLLVCWSLCSFMIALTTSGLGTPMKGSHR